MSDTQTRAQEDTKVFHHRFKPSMYAEFAENAERDGYTGPSELLRQLVRDYNAGKRMR